MGLIDSVSTICFTWCWQREGSVIQTVFSILVDRENDVFWPDILSCACALQKKQVNKKNQKQNHHHIKETGRNCPVFSLKKINLTACSWGTHHSPFPPVVLHLNNLTYSAVIQSATLQTPDIQRFISWIPGIAKSIIVCQRQYKRKGEEKSQMHSSSLPPH